MVLFALTFIQGISSSQSCLPEGIYFQTQAQIDNFQVNYPGCSVIEGNVTIRSSLINNLNGLSVLSSIEGHLNIHENTMLNSTKGLDNVTHIGGDLTLWLNNSLTSLTGLDNLTSIGGILSIGSNENLVSLNGLKNLTSIGKDLSIWYNSSLTSLSGMDNLASIGGCLAINDNAVLNGLSGLDHVTFIGDGLHIRNNDVLATLTGLDNVASIGGDLQVWDNDALSSLAGIDNMDVHSISDLIILENSSLSTCHVKSICDYIAAPNGTVVIHFNAFGCNSQEEVLEACSSGIAESPGQNRCRLFPNPILNETTFSLTLDTPTHANLVIIDRLGRVVVTIVNDFITKGEHRFTWNVDGLPTGIYFYRLTINGIINGKLLVVR